MASKGFSRVTPTHESALIKRYRKLRGEERFWLQRQHHPRASSELARLNTAINALATALPVVVPNVAVSTLRPLRFELAVPLPGHALTRAVLLCLRKYGSSSLAELTERIAADHKIESALHDHAKLEKRVQKVLDGLTAKGGLTKTQETPSYWALKE